MSFGPPLDGVRVLDFTHVLAGPFCTRLLADLGADVVRVESARHPDAPWRSAVDAEIGRDVSYLVISRNKRSAAIDLKTPEGREVATRLASSADVVTENFSSGVMERLGLGFDRLAASNPRLVYVSMSGYGHEGPRRDWTSMNTNLQAYSGLMMVTGRENDAPTAISNSWMDYIGGLHAAFAVIEALAARAATGRGRMIDLSQFEAGVATIGPLLLASAVTRSASPRTGNRSDHAAPQGCYRCAGEDEWCALGVETDEQWAALVRAMEHPAWCDEPRFATLDLRMRSHDALDEHLRAWTRGLESGEVERRLRAEGVPALFPGYQNLHLLPLFRHKIAYGTQGFPWTAPFASREINYHPGLCPVAEELHGSSFFGMGICSYDLCPDDVSMIIEAFHKVWKNIDKLAA